MLVSAVQPGIVSLFSSTGSDPLQLFSVHTDPSLPAHSVIHLVHDTSSHPPPPPPAILIQLSPDENSDAPSPWYTLDQTVLHIQSPTLPTTYIRCPPDRAAGALRGIEEHLGIRHPWMHIQVRELGSAWSFELGIVDLAGRLGIVRCSTFQARPIRFLRSSHNI
jgi:hypothetical protein